MAVEAEGREGRIVKAIRLFSIDSVYCWYIIVIYFYMDTKVDLQKILFVL